jgi:hypothetical protein
MNSSYWDMLLLFTYSGIFFSYSVYTAVKTAFYQPPMPGLGSKKIINSKYPVMSTDDTETYPIKTSSLICSGEYFLMTGVRSLTQHGQQRECQRGLSA